MVQVRRLYATARAAAAPTVRRLPRPLGADGLRRLAIFHERRFVHQHGRMVETGRHDGRHHAYVAAVLDVYLAAGHPGQVLDCHAGHAAYDVGRRRWQVEVRLLDLLHQTQTATAVLVLRYLRHLVHVVVLALVHGEAVEKVLAAVGLVGRQRAVVAGREVRCLRVQPRNGHRLEVGLLLRLREVHWGHVGLEVVGVAAGRVQQRHVADGAVVLGEEVVHVVGATLRRHLRPAVRQTADGRQVLRLDRLVGERLIGNRGGDVRRCGTITARFRGDRRTDGAAPVARRLGRVHLRWGLVAEHVLRHLRLRVRTSGDRREVDRLLRFVLALPHRLIRRVEQRINL